MHLLCNRLPVQNHHESLCSRLWRTASATPLSTSLHHLHPVRLLREQRGEAVRSRPCAQSAQPQLLSFYCSAGVFYVGYHTRWVWLCIGGRSPVSADLLERCSPHMCFSFGVNTTKLTCADWWILLWVCATFSLHLIYIVLTVGLSHPTLTVSDVCCTEAAVRVSEPQRLPAACQPPAIWEGPLPWHYQIPPCPLQV